MSSETTAPVPTNPNALAERRALEASVNRSKEEALRTYDEALRKTGHSEAGSIVGDKLTEAAYVASHRLDEAGNSIKDSLKSVGQSINQSIDQMKEDHSSDPLKELAANAKVEQPVAQPAVSTINQSINQSNNQPLNPSTSRIQV